MPARAKARSRSRTSSSFHRRVGFLHAPRYDYATQHKTQEQKRRERALRATAHAERAESKASQVEKQAKAKPLTKANVMKMTTEQIRKTLAAKEQQLEKAQVRLANAAKRVPAAFKAKLERMPLKSLKAMAKKQVEVVRHMASRVRMAAQRLMHRGSYGGYSSGSDDWPWGGGWGGGGSPPDSPTELDDLDLEKCEKELEEEEAKLEYVSALIEVKETENDIDLLRAELARREKAAEAEESATEDDLPDDYKDHAAKWEDRMAAYEASVAHLWE